jgi:hypothetical protein
MAENGSNGNGTNGSIRLTPSLGLLLIAGLAAYYGSLTRPIENDVRRLSVDSAERERAIFVLAEQTNKFQSKVTEKLGEIENQMLAMRTQNYLRVAYEHAYTQMLWKRSTGEDLPPIPPYMPGSEALQR